MIRTYAELSKLKTFKERYEYLRLGGVVGTDTFGFDRYLNQIFYRSTEWRSVRDFVIVRDNGCDLGIEGHEIYGKILIHHMNPISVEDILRRSDFLLNPEYLISTILTTHNSKNKDRRYDAIQMSSIFDGIIRDGILQHVGTAMMVKESTGMMVNVGIGRAWFNHTWTLNDALLPLTVPQSEVILNRIDAVILEVDSRESVRANTIKIVKGTPATNPVKPSMIKTNDRWQYPLAYIRVNSGVTSIRQANITNTVGTSECPFVTAPLEKMSIDALVAQWKDQWDAFYEKETSDMEATNTFWKDQWSKWFNAQTEEIQQSYLDWEKQWNDWYATQTADMQETNAYWKQLWATWFNEYTNNNTSEMAAWRENTQALFDEWFQQLKDTLSENVEANLANQILELQERTKILEEIVEGIRTEFTVYNKLYDNGYENHDKLLDSSDGTIIDSDIDPIVARAYSSSLILDSNGQPIDGRVIFCIR